jgi:hypothetical protein
VARKKTIGKNQFDNIQTWMEFYKEHKKLPYNEILCCECKTFYAKLKGVGLKFALQNAGGSIEKMLTSTLCKECKTIHKKNEPPKERKKKVKTQEEIEEEIEQIRRDMPKIDLNAPRNIINLSRDKEMCAILTHSSCIRPDIYLDNDRTCDYCSINKYCSCPIKKFSGKNKNK